MSSERSPAQAAIIVASMSPTVARPAHSHYRWTVCALLFFATTISYVDRQVLSMLAETLKTHIGWTDMQYGQITGAFSLAYATGLLLVGWLLDKFGTRLGFAIAVGLWSVAAMMHAAATTADRKSTRLNSSHLGISY